MDDATNSNTEVTLINVFEVPKGVLDAAIKAWTKGRDFLQKQPGYVSTALHKSIAPDAKFALVNIAIWESPETFNAAIAAMNAADTSPKIEGLRYAAGLYTVVARD
ncbi:antibiotic biosynthesis monooxygenase family protein [Sulfitobacter sp.]|uniref:antibiotic biosynthesis monooxygenase family protein n=1 Tax=Sulfitobacter sp. TaxID=1903071 RepID=UPI003002B93B